MSDRDTHSRVAFAYYQGFLMSLYAKDESLSVVFDTFLVKSMDVLGHGTFIFKVIIKFLSLFDCFFVLPGTPSLIIQFPPLYRDLSYNRGLTGSLPPAIGSLSKLTRL